MRRVPPGDGEDSPGREPRQEELPCLQRIQRILSKSKCSRSRCGEGIDKGDLNDIKPLTLPRNVASRLIVHERDLWIPVEMTCELAESPVNRIDDVFVDLDSPY